MVGVKSKKELKNEYKVSYATLKKWLDMVPGLRNTRKHYFSPIETELIYHHLGKPF